MDIVNELHGLFVDGGLGTFSGQVIQRDFQGICDFFSYFDGREHFIAFIPADNLPGDADGLVQIGLLAVVGVPLGRYI